MYGHYPERHSLKNTRQTASHTSIWALQLGDKLKYRLEEGIRECVLEDRGTSEARGDWCIIVDGPLGAVASERRVTAAEMEEILSARLE
jgi:hypothetical protein